MRVRVGLCATLMLLMVCASMASGTTICGDANDDGYINLGDATYLISYVFRNGPAPDPLGKADVNWDGQVNVGDVVWLVRYVFIGDFPPVCPPFAGSVPVTDCKDILAKSDTLVDDCIAWSYDGESTLSIHHINAGFNCCPGDISFDIDAVGEVITVTEIEETQACNCNCLFDIDYDINSLPPGTYRIVFNEPYVLPGEDELLEFSIDLTSAGSGLYCVPRDHYPWGMSAAGGEVVGNSGCKSYKNAAEDWVECLQWAYDGYNGVLSLRHVNATANCCIDSIFADFDIAPGSIGIVEHEELQGGGCDCNCQYDVDMVINNIAPGEVTISLVGVYTPPELPLHITIDLQAEPVGEYCPE